MLIGTEMFEEKIPHEYSQMNPGDKIYPLKKVEDLSCEVVNIHQNHWLALHHVSETTLDFALYEFHSAECQEEGDEMVSLIFEGSGIKGLREMRHIWWKHDDLEMRGYTYYLDGDAVIKTFTYLKKYFDY